VRIALLSDTHIAADPNDNFRGFTPYQNLKKTADAVSRTKFDLLLVNGDLARLKGETNDYAGFSGLIDPLLEKIPMVATLGNHDDRQNVRNALTKQAAQAAPVDKKFVSTLDAGGVHFILLDSLLATNVTPGQLGQLQRSWLERHLDSLHTNPVVVFVHHNPDTESDTGLVDAARLLNILTPRPLVKALIFGHTHVFRCEKREGLHLINLPAVGYNFDDGVPIGWIDGTFSSRGLDMNFHVIGGSTKIEDQTASFSWR
jgi:Icc protein